MHIPVLLKEVLHYLDPQPGQNFIDATISHGGHALALWCSVQPTGKILGIEWDTDLFTRMERRIQNLGIRENLLLVNDSYANLEQIVSDQQFTEIKGVLFDVGLSSWHLDESGRGFSFRKDEGLDMRYQITNPLTAKEIVNNWEIAKLAKIISEWGEEKHSLPIAQAIADEREKKPIETSRQLAEIIYAAVPSWYTQQRIHPATKTFQALRIAVNDELGNVEQGLEAGFKVLAPGGKLAIITFQGLEDKLVKDFIKRHGKGEGIEMVTSGAVKPDFNKEIKFNPRARSAKLRVIKKSL